MNRLLITVRSVSNNRIRVIAGRMFGEVPQGSAVVRPGAQGHEARHQVAPMNRIIPTSLIASGMSPEMPQGSTVLNEVVQSHEVQQPGSISFSSNMWLQATAAAQPFGRFNLGRGLAVDGAAPEPQR